MRETGKPLSELRQVMRRYPAGARQRAASPTRHGSATSAAIAEAIHEAEAELGESGRVLVRPSGTEPLVRVMAEATDEETAARGRGRGWSRS